MAEALDRNCLCFPPPSLSLFEFGTALDAPRTHGICFSARVSTCSTWPSLQPSLGPRETCLAHGVRTKKTSGSHTGEHQPMFFTLSWRRMLLQYGRSEEGRERKKKKDNHDIQQIQSIATIANPLRRSLRFDLTHDRRGSS